MYFTDHSRCNSPKLLHLAMQEACSCTGLPFAAAASRAPRVWFSRFPPRQNGRLPWLQLRGLSERSLRGGGRGAQCRSAPKEAWKRAGGVTMARASVQ